MNQLYLWINIGTFAAPFLLSFDKKVAFFKHWKTLFPAIFIMGIVFITWDVLFTINGIWGFNDNYLTGVFALSLPIEEWLFFFTVPYACLFIYECVNAYFKKDLIKPLFKPFILTLAPILLIIGFFNITKLYTSITFIATGLYLLYHYKKQYHYFSNFLLSYFISLIPFLLVNGLLTGSFIEDQIVWYNSNHILNIRMFTIPIEDSIYNLLMLLMTTQLHERFKKSN